MAKVWQTMRVAGLLGTAKGMETVRKAIMSPVRAILLNRIAIVLAFAGVAVAGTLTYTHFLGVVPPCGVDGGGCSSVLTHPSSKWGPIPVSAMGLLAYLFILGISIYRSVAGFANSKPAGMAAYSVGLIGAVVSIGLQVYAKLVIGEYCLWCIASAVIMTVLFMVLAGLYQATAGLEPVSAAEPERAGTESTGRKGDWAIVGGAAALSAVVMVLAGMNTVAGIRGTDKVIDEDRSSFILAEDSHFRGPETAPITIVEFGDLCCSACQKAFAMLTNIEQQYEGKIKIVFRHFPLYQRHKESYRASVYAEYAAAKGKFWEFMTKAYQLPIEEVENAAVWDNVLLSVNLDVAEAQKQYADDQSEAFQKVHRDLTAANKLGITVTPTFFIIAEGEKPYSAQLSSITHKLENDPKYRRLLGKDGG